MLRRVVLIVGCFVLLDDAGHSAVADELANQLAAIEVITKAAGDICYTVEQQGSRKEIRLSGDASAELDSVIRKVIDLGIKGAGAYTNEQHKGVLQEELATTLQHSMDCKKDVFDNLVNRVLGWKLPASQSVINQIGDFISEGEQIANSFESTNDIPSLITHYTQWSSNVEKYLSQNLDRAYAAQFRSAVSIN
jgi:hypothetical protein